MKVMRIRNQTHGTGRKTPLHHHQQQRHYQPCSDWSRLIYSPQFFFFFWGKNNFMKFKVKFEQKKKTKIPDSHPGFQASCDHVISQSACFISHFPLNRTITHRLHCCRILTRLKLQKLTGHVEARRVDGKEFLKLWKSRFSQRRRWFFSTDSRTIRWVLLFNFSFLISFLHPSPRPRRDFSKERKQKSGKTKETKAEKIFNKNHSFLNDFHVGQNVWIWMNDEGLNLTNGTKTTIKM